MRYFTRAYILILSHSHVNECPWRFFFFFFVWQRLLENSFCRPFLQPCAKLVSQFCAGIVVRPSKHILFTVGRITFVNFDSLNGLTESKFLKGTKSTRADFNYKEYGNKKVPSSFLTKRKWHEIIHEFYKVEFNLAVFGRLNF